MAQTFHFTIIKLEHMALGICQGRCHWCYNLSIASKEYFLIFLTKYQEKDFSFLFSKKEIIDFIEIRMFVIMQILL